MKIIINLFRFFFLTVILIPLWILVCIIGFFVAVFLHYLFYDKYKSSEKYRNNINKIFRDFKNDITSIFCYY